MALPKDETDIEELWKCHLGFELQSFDAVQEVLASVTGKLDQLGMVNDKVKLLKTIPGVGARLAEVVVAYIDDPGRFSNGKQVGCYAGLTPRQFQSGDMDRRGKISKEGHRLLRSMLVEVSWLALRYNKYLREFYRRVSGPANQSRKKAIVAVARKLLVCCWAMLRDGRPWQEPVGDF